MGKERFNPKGAEIAVNSSAARESLMCNVTMVVRLLNKAGWKEQVVGWRTRQRGDRR